MKRIIYFLFAASLVVSCSSDDDPLPVLQSINAGGPAFEFDGKQWEADQYVIDGKSYINEIDIESTDNDTLFHTESFNNPDFIYEIPVTGTGPYTIELHFAEIFHGVMNSNGAGARVFNVDIENAQGKLTNYDIFVRAGGSAKAVKESFPGIMVEDGSLTLQFTAVEGDAKVSGIEIRGNM